MTSAAHPIEDQQETVAETAARWLARRHEGLRGRDEDAFVAWLAADPSHKKAYDDIAHGWAVFDAMGAIPQLSAMRTEALVANPPRRRPVPQWMAIAAALLVAVLVGFGTLTHSFPPSGKSDLAQASPRELRTVKGERSTMMLADGSTITLNTDTRIRVVFARAERRVVLLSGQAYFQVARDKSRPFVVSAGDREVVAVGTEFEVRLDSRQVAVALVEGKVKVRPRTDIASRSDSPASADLRPGERLVFAQGSSTTSIKSADVADLTRWREGQVRFDAAPLREVVAEMNRYSMVPIVIDDPRLLDLPVSGVFQTGQSKNFVAALTELFPVAAETKDAEIRLRKRGAS